MGEFQSDVCSDFLFAQPSFWSGVARCLDIGRGFDMYNFSPTDELADARALFADWKMVGQEIKKALGFYQREMSHRQGSLFDAPAWQGSDDHTRQRTTKARITRNFRKIA